MDEKELTLSMHEVNSPLFGKWAACLVESVEMDSVAYVLEGLTGYGDTPLEAASSLLAMAAKECMRRGVS